MRDADKQDHQHLLPQVHLGITWQPAGQETELGGLSAHLGGDGSGEVGAMVGVGEDGCDRVSFPQLRTSRGGKRLRVVLCKVTECHLCGRSPGDGKNSAFLPAIFKLVRTGNSISCGSQSQVFFEKN